MRLFIAVCLPEEVKDQLSAYANNISTLARGANITRRDNFHLTLAFLGDALTEEAACSVLDKISGVAFKLYSDKPGCFKRGNSAIWWLGLKSSKELTALHNQVNQQLAAVGFKADNRPYSPHLTLARKVQGANIGQLPPPPRFIIPVDALYLMESTTIDKMLIYRRKNKISF